MNDELIHKRSILHIDNSTLENNSDDTLAFHINIALSQGLNKSPKKAKKSTIKKNLDIIEDPAAPPTAAVKIKKDNYTEPQSTFMPLSQDTNSVA